MLTPNYWRFKRACDTVHKFSLEVIQKRREALQEQKVGRTLLVYVEVKVQIAFIFQRNGESVQKKGRYLDFIDMLLEAKVCVQ